VQSLTRSSIFGLVCRFHLSVWALRLGDSDKAVISRPVNKHGHMRRPISLGRKFLRHDANGTTGSGVALCWVVPISYQLLAIGVIRRRRRCLVPWITGGATFAPPLRCSSNRPHRSHVIRRMHGPTSGVPGLRKDNTTPGTLISPCPLSAVRQVDVDVNADSLPLPSS